MSTNQETPAVNAAITEAQVVAFLQAKQAKLRKATGIHYATILCRVEAETGAPDWRTYCDTGDHIDAPTADAAIAAQVAYLQPDSKAVRAKEARERAAALLAEADKLEKEAAK